MSLLDVLLLVLLALAVIFDIKSRRIPNFLVLTGMVGALGFYVFQAGLAGLLFSLKGLGLGILLLVVPFALRGMGAGDVKLLGMVGALKGSAFVVNAFLWMALFGGVIALGCLIKAGKLSGMLMRLGRGAVLALTGGRYQVFLGSLETEPFDLYFPYALAIALGVVAAYCKGWW